MTKAEVMQQLEEPRAPVNQGPGSPSSAELIGRFVDFVFLPFYRHKWTRSTARKFRSFGNEREKRVFLIHGGETVVVANTN